MKHRIVLVIDPGFDGSKIVVNGQVLRIPFMIEDITSRQANFPVGRSDNDFIRSRIGDKTYLIGEYARKSMLERDHRENAAQMDTFYTIGRFASKQFESGLISFISYGLYYYSEYTKENSKKPFLLEDLPETELYVSVALPHQQCDELWNEHVKQILLKPVKLELLVGNKEPISIEYQLKEENCLHQSQAVSALLSMVMDDEGNTSEEEMFASLPCLVIDAGYVTVGIFKLSRDGSLDKSESNQLYAMYNVNEAVANKIKVYRPDITSYNIEALSQDPDAKIQYEDDNGKVVNFDVIENQKTETEKVSIQLFNHLKEKFDKLFDIKKIIVAGGTGEKYYEYLESLFDEREKDHVLARPTLGGKQYEPVFAVAIGLYKATLATINPNH